MARAAAPVAEVFVPLDVAAGDATLPSYGEKGYIVSVFLSEQMREIYVVRYVTEYVWICVWLYEQVYMTILSLHVVHV